MLRYLGMPAAWHGCLTHNRNHCTECRTCSCTEKG